MFPTERAERFAVGRGLAFRIRRNCNGYQFTKGKALPARRINLLAGRTTGEQEARLYAAKDKPDRNRDANGKSNNDPEVKKVSDGSKQKSDDRA